MVFFRPALLFVVANLSQNIFPLTTFWKFFLFELRMSADVVGNVEKLWAEIDQCWDDFIQKDDIVEAVTTGYFWIDLSNIAEEHS
jgi:hypothetical protein